MLVISVVVIAIVAAAYAFVPTFSTGVDALGADVHRILRTGNAGLSDSTVASGSARDGR